MKVILLSDVKKLGKKGDVVETAEGYGRNYLIPRKLAKEATAVNMNQAMQDKKVAEHRAAQRKDEAVMLASQVEKVTVKMKLKVGANGKLFGAITSKDVAEALMKQTGLEVDRRKICFNVAVYSEKGIVGRGTHERFIIDEKRFGEKISSR
ncbi:MAG: 50S ribosomal protein L9, partial [Acidaminococcaceae bacterium]|nr:50S ribosomal protein L9 [Acidaminococcaceae bacterium]